MSSIHKLLSRQIKKSTDSKKNVDQKHLYHLISQAYGEADKRYSLLNQSMELMSDELLELNSSLREESLKTEAIIQSVNDGIFSVDSSGRIYSSNKGGQNIFGYQESELSKMYLKNILPDIDFDSMKNKSKEYLKNTQTLCTLTTETRGLKKDKETFYAEVYISPINLKVQELYVCNIRDITIQKENEQNLYSAAYYDKLTKLPNRALFLEHIQEIVERNKRGEDVKSALLFIDLDRFKVINDSLGHNAGDELLRQVASRLKKTARQYDIVSRLGGDEFTILINEISNQTMVLKSAQRFINAFDKPFKVMNKELFLSASIGAHIISKKDTLAEEILRNSDLAMYKAKNRGRGCFEMFNEDQLTAISSLLQMENDLRHALKKGELVVFYQPIVETTQGKVIGFESLVRWEHPKHGLILPDRFIHIAEETGLIKDLGYYVLKKSCLKIKEFQKLALPGEKLSIAVNISPNQLTTQKEAKKILNIIKRAKLPPGVLKLECTETAFMKESPIIKSFFHDLKEVGVDLCIDDFGTGYSALEYIHRFPFDILKIDRTFISSMRQNKKDLNLVTGIVALAHNLGLKVVAEGVEHTDEVRLLKVMGVDYIQGYYFSRPLPFKSACSFITENNVSVTHQWHFLNKALTGQKELKK